MARHVLIVEKSDMTRRVLQARILAIFDDVILSEAASITQAEALLEKSIIHLVLYGWEPGDDLGISFCREELKAASGEKIPFVFLVGGGKKVVQVLEGQGIENFVRMPCSAEDLAMAMDQNCHSSSLRESKRYCISGARGLIEQRGLSIDCKILNVSLGGMLCEFEMDAHFNCIDPVMISARLGSHDAKVENIYTILSNLNVIESNSDHTPRLVRMGFKFLQISDKDLDNLKTILEQAEEEEDDDSGQY